MIREYARSDVIRIDSADRKDTYYSEEGYLYDDPIVGRIGIQIYHNPDGSERKEYRPAEEVFAPEAMESAKGKPVIITHDAGYVNKDNASDEEIGTIIDVHRDGDYLRAHIVIHDTDAMKDSGLKELSLGYNLEADDSPGEYNGEHYDMVQRKIRINHLALVGEARAGDKARLNIDGKDKGTVVNDSNEGGTEMAKARVKAMDSDDFQKKVDEFTKQQEAEENSQATDGDDELTTEEKIQEVRDHRDRRDADEDPKDLKSATKTLEEQEKDINTLLDCIDAMEAEKAMTATDGDDGEEKPQNEDSEDDEPKDVTEDDDSELTEDSVDARVNRRLSILRVADKLNLDGVDGLKNEEIMKRVVQAVNPSVRFDGKSKGFIKYAYEYAVENLIPATKKNANFQRRQMLGESAKRLNMDSKGRQRQLSMSQEARMHMIERANGGEQ